MSLAAKAGSLLVRAGKLLTNCLCCCAGECPTGISECAPQCQCASGNCTPCRDTACPNGQQDCGPGCTCSGGLCVGCRETACPNGDECGPGCACVDGQCVPAGNCCINNACDPSYTTQEACEECTTTYTCYEELFQEDPEQPCPEGWSGGYGYCSRTTTVASCAECLGSSCYEQKTGPCGKFVDKCEDISECTEVEHYCDCQCRKNCTIKFLGELAYTVPPGVVIYPDGVAWPTPAATATRRLADEYDGCNLVSGPFDTSWAVMSDCSSVAGVVTRGEIVLTGISVGVSGVAHRPGWDPLPWSCAAVVRPIVSIACDCAGYAESVSITGFLEYEGGCNNVMATFSHSISAEVCCP
jgi:hypothetical protein